MTLAERLAELVRAAFSGLYIRSFEHDEATREIAGLCRRDGWTLATWASTGGWPWPGSRPTPPTSPARPTRWRPSGR